ncbi:MAG: hypothetical protein ACOCUF_00645 [Patescibacteria group bacterium]
MKKKILLGFTTTSGSDYKKKLEEIEEMGIKEAAFFLTGLDLKRRKELYGLLERSSLEEAPHIHMRNDMEKWEVDFLEKRFNVQAYNIHDKNSLHPFENCKDKFLEYAEKIFIENTETIPEKDELKELGGLCIDFSHWQDNFLKGEKDHYQKILNLIKKFPIGCSHISAVQNKLNEFGSFAKHSFRNLREFDYMVNFVNFLPDLVSLELENSFQEQMKVKRYLEKNLEGKV